MSQERIQRPLIKNTFQHSFFFFLLDFKDTNLNDRLLRSKFLNNLKD